MKQIITMETVAEMLQKSFSLVFFFLLLFCFYAVMKSYGLIAKMLGYTCQRYSLCSLKKGGMSMSKSPDLGPEHSSRNKHPFTEGH